MEGSCDHANEQFVSTSVEQFINLLSEIAFSRTFLSRIMPIVVYIFREESLKSFKFNITGDQGNSIIL